MEWITTRPGVKEFLRGSTSGVVVLRGGALGLLRAFVQALSGGPLS